MNWLRAVPLALTVIAIGLPLTVLAAVYSLGSDTGSADHTAHHVQPSHPVERTDAAVTFRNDMRKLWEDHVTWTRLFIVSFAADLPDQDATAGRLLQNQADIGDAVKPFYGEAAGDALTELLREHILLAVDLLAAAKSGDGDAFEAARAAWYVNGEEIAAFLHAANPDNWPLDETSHHMTMHLDLTLEEASHRLSGNFGDEIAAYDEVHDAILEMADFLSLGIIRQFPGEFRASVR